MGNYFFSPISRFSLSLCLYLSLFRGWESCFGRESEFASTRLEIDYGFVFFLLLQFSGETIARFDSFLEYFILLKDIVIGIICYVSSIIRKREKKIA